MGGDITVLVAGQDCAAVAEAAAKLDGVDEGDPRRGRGLRPPPGRAADRARARHGRRLRAHRLPGDHLGQERRAAARGAARRHGDLRHHRRRRPRHLRAADLRRQRHPDRAVVRPEEGRHRARRQLRGDRRAGPRPRSRPRPAAADPGALVLGRGQGRGLRPARAHLARRIVVSGGRGVGSEENFAIIESARRQARRRGRRLAAPRSTPATPRTTGRSARPARSSPPSSTSPSASPARSSTSPA